MLRETELELADVYSIYGWSTYSPPEIASLVIRASENHWFPLIRPAIKTRFSRGGCTVVGLWLTSEAWLVSDFSEEKSLPRSA